MKYFILGFEKAAGLKGFKKIVSGKALSQIYRIEKKLIKRNTPEALKRLPRIGKQADSLSLKTDLYRILARPGSMELENPPERYL